MVILVVFKGFLLVKNLEILIQIVPDRSIYYYLALAAGALIVPSIKMYASA